MKILEVITEWFAKLADAIIELFDDDHHRPAI
jgi:hypothetical protein